MESKPTVLLPPLHRRPASWTSNLRPQPLPTSGSWRRPSSMAALPTPASIPA
uniref:Uncharacterized protein n=1 Tax=Arundo donax TaxID=35708 RepID=A0A0A9HQ40_ARUDO